MQTEEIYKIFKGNPYISTDSRKILPGSMFFALKGENFNGNIYAEEALKKGAKYAVIDETAFKKNRESYILVDNVLKSLQELANYHRRKLGIPVLGITGTNGKTTTKELFISVFAKKFKVTATEGNLNNHIGVPLTLLSMNPDTEIGIVEMGANHPDEIKLLCEIAEPDYGLITNIGKAHLEGFGSLEGVVKAKSEIYAYLEKSSGTAFYNIENPVLGKLLKKFKCKNIPYGQKNGAYFTSELLESDPFLRFSISITDQANKIQSYEFNTHLVGSYNLENVLAAICAGLFFKIPLDSIINAVEEYIPTNNRSQFKIMGSNKLLLDYYNANPSSMEIALLNFKTIPEKKLRKILILGEMLELGKESKQEHTKILKLINTLGFKEVYLVGKEFKQDGYENFQYFENSSTLKEHLHFQKIENAYILIKGSRGVKMEQILDCF